MRRDSISCWFDCFLPCGGWKRKLAFWIAASHCPSRLLSGLRIIRKIYFGSSGSSWLFPETCCWCASCNWRRRCHSRKRLRSWKSQQLCLPLFPLSSRKTRRAASSRSLASGKASLTPWPVPRRPCVCGSRTRWRSTASSACRRLGVSACGSKLTWLGGQKNPGAGSRMSTLCRTRTHPTSASSSNTTPCCGTKRRRWICRVCRGWSQSRPWCRRPSEEGWGLCRIVLSWWTISHCRSALAALSEFRPWKPSVLCCSAC